MKHNGRCRNYNHGRANAPVRFCPTCGELVNNNISAAECSEEKHARKRRDGSMFCVDCGEQVAQQT